MRDPYTAQTRYAISSNMLLYVILLMRPIHRSKPGMPYPRIIVIVGASLYATEASCLKMSGSAYLGPGVLIVNKKKNSKTEKFSVQGFSLFVKTTVLKKLKRNFQSNNVQSTYPISYHFLYCCVFDIGIHTRVLTSVENLG